MLRNLSLLLYLDFQDSPNDEEDIRDSQEYLNDLKEEFQERSVLAKSKMFFKNRSQRFSGAKGIDETNATNVANYNKVKAKLALLSSSTLIRKSSMVKNKGLVVEAYEWDEEQVSLDDNEMVEVKVFMELADDESIAVSKESARNGEWVKILMKKEHPSLAVETYTASENSLLAVGMPCAFYSQQSSPKLDAPSALKFSRIK
nr:hypothetical protein [Tanacetum cinerariifolium]